MNSWRNERPPESGEMFWWIVEDRNHIAGMGSEWKQNSGISKFTKTVLCCEQQRNVRFRMLFALCFHFVTVTRVLLSTSSNSGKRVIQ
jgi:hypothetical protein